MQIMLPFSRIFRSDSAKLKGIDKKTKRRLFSVLLIILVGSIGLLVVMHNYLTGQRPPTTNQTWSRTPFFASIDTMKESRDTETRPLSSNEILDIVKLSASVNTNYITVDTHWEYSHYLLQWINAIRATGRHVWFRSQPNQWENQNGATGTMTPAQYKAAEQNFILTHISLFQSGDIFDACPEPEQGHYWFNQYGDRWTWNAPNSATRDYNAFIRDTTDVANAAFQQKGIQGVITTIRSINTFFASHPDVFEQATAEKLGRMTIDSYPEQSTTDPLTAANARVDELKTIENIWHLPIIIGEMGYSNNVEVNDVTQQSVLKAEFQAIKPLAYVAGMNYWVGSGTNTSGGYTYIFAKSGQGWFLRPAANELSLFYKTKGSI
ncbi:MAG TPA: hypothetical protein VHV10_10155 [Ktedonobacteraceae bacterium]|nr:hypothetical protein [Ktedonobacteraceae bacterium]